MHHHNITRAIFNEFCYSVTMQVWKLISNRQIVPGFLYPIFSLTDFIDNFVFKESLLTLLVEKNCAKASPHHVTAVITFSSWTYHLHTCQIYYSRCLSGSTEVLPRRNNFSRLTVSKASGHLLFSPFPDLTSLTFMAKEESQSLQQRLPHP